MDIGKVFVFGLDGATFDLMDPLIEKGELPNISSLMKKGNSGRLQSSNPDLSPPAWTSFMTGKHPGKHGIIDFFCHNEGTYELEFLNASFRKAKPLWQILSEQEKKVCVLNVPFTYPPEKVNGIMISGMDTPGIESDFIFPSSFRGELESSVGPYLFEKPMKNIRDNGVANYLEHVFTITDNRFETAQFLLKKDDWGFFMVVFESTDRVQHNMWKYYDRNHPEYSEEKHKLFGDALHDTYRDLDTKLGELLKILPEQATVLLLSDHGFGPLYKGVRLEYWLANNDYLKVAKRLKSGIFPAGKEKIKQLVPPLVKNLLKKVLPEKVGAQSEISLNHIDFAGSKVFTVGGHGHLVINLQGREPEGIITPGEEYDNLCSSLINQLKELTDPETGKKVVEDAQLRDEIYDEYQENTPDIIIKWAKGYYNIGEKELRFLGLGAEENQLFTPHRWSGNHRPDGIFVLSGHNVSSSGNYEDAGIMDLAPTILALLGVEIPDDLDGRVLTELLEEQFLQDYGVNYSVALKEKNNQQRKYSDEEMRQISERLKDLGYLE